MRHPRRTIPATAPLLVEFIGAPGSGKTRIAAEVAALLAASGVSTAGGSELESIVEARFVGKTKLSTSVRWLGYLVSQPAWAGVVAGWLMSRDGTRVLERAVRITHRIRALSVVADSGIDVWIPDEWIMHEIALAMAGARSNGRARGFEVFDVALDRLPAQLLIVQCEVDPVIAAHRVAKRRSTSDFDGRSSDDLMPVIRELSEISTMLRERAALSGRATLHVRTDGSSPGAMRSIADAILARMTHIRLAATGSTPSRASIHDSA